MTPPQQRGLSLRTILAACAILATLAFAASAEPRRIANVRNSPMDKIAPYRRSLWVSRWEYKTPQDIERICYNAASARFTDILFQVRGSGTVYFNSPYEPWAWELNSSTPGAGLGRNPGWDPLATMVKEGRRRGLRVHAWINAMPAWSLNSAPAKDVDQVYGRHPSWLMVDAQGNRMRPNGFYAFLDPGLPDVREHLAKLVGRMAKDYEIDGVHLDYIRYPLAEEAGKEFSFHPEVVGEFKKTHHGATPQSAPDEWVKFRQRQVTATIRGIRDAMDKNRPGIELTSTAMADPVRGHKLAGQDAQRWIDDGIVDAVVPMAYVRNDLNRFSFLMEPYFTPTRRSHVWAGIWPREGNSNYTDQIEIAASGKSAGVAIFSYSEIFHGHKPTSRAVSIYKTFAGLKGPDTGREALIASPPTLTESPKKTVASKVGGTKPKAKSKAVASAAKKSAATKPKTSAGAKSKSVAKAPSAPAKKPTTLTVASADPGEVSQKPNAAPARRKPTASAKPSTKTSVKSFAK